MDAIFAELAGLAVLHVVCVWWEVGEEVVGRESKRLGESLLMSTASRLKESIVVDQCVYCESLMS